MLWAMVAQLRATSFGIAKQDGGAVDVLPKKVFDGSCCALTF